MNERKKERTCLKNSTNFPYLLVFFFFYFTKIVVFMKFDEIESNFRMEVPGHRNILISIQGKIFLDCPGTMARRYFLGDDGKISACDQFSEDQLW